MIETLNICGKNMESPTRITIFQGNLLIYRGRRVKLVV